MASKMEIETTQGNFIFELCRFESPAEWKILRQGDRYPSIGTLEVRYQGKAPVAVNWNYAQLGLGVEINLKGGQSFGTITRMKNL